MSVGLIVRPRAEQDMVEAGLWYEGRRAGTALYFLRCVDAAIALITRHPESAPLRLGRFAAAWCLVFRSAFSIPLKEATRLFMECFIYRVTPTKFASCWSVEPANNLH